MQILLVRSAERDTSQGNPNSKHMTSEQAIVPHCFCQLVLVRLIFCLCQAKPKSTNSPTDSDQNKWTRGVKTLLEDLY